MEHVCLNCNAGYVGKFCPDCGQKSSTHRVTFHAILHDIPHSVFHIDKGLFYTFWQMLYMPGKLVKNYVDGKRVKYFAPLAYLFLLSAISSFVSHYTEHSITAGSNMPSGILFPEVGRFFRQYPALMFCLLTPFISIWSWLFNLKSGYNYWENLILNIYLIAQFNIAYILFRLAKMWHWYDSGNVTPVIILFLAYITFAYAQFYNRPVSLGRVLNNIVMFLCIAFTLLNGLMLTGFMTPWWW
jgi:hypothetical protein